MRKCYYLFDWNLQWSIMHHCSLPQNYSPPLIHFLHPHFPQSATKHHPHCVNYAMAWIMRVNTVYINIYNQPDTFYDALKIWIINLLGKKTGAQNIVKEIKQYQEKWLQHVQRMDTDRLPKQALQYKPKGRRNIGRPRKRWRDQLHLEDQGTGNMPNTSGTWWWWRKYRLPSKSCFRQVTFKLRKIEFFNLLT